MILREDSREAAPPPYDSVVEVLKQEVEGQSGVPVLMNVPFFGKLFREKTTRKDRRELLIFITPRIVDA